MKKSQIPKNFAIQKLLKVEDAILYFQLGRKTLFEVAAKANAIRRIGRCVRIDKIILDKWIEENPNLKSESVNIKRPIFMPYDWGEEYSDLCEKFNCR